MAEPIGPGDWVECVDASPMRFFETGLTVGAVYLVEGCTYPRDGLIAGLLLRGVRHPGNLLGDYNPRRFRPIYKPSADLIQSLLRPVPAEPETVGA